MRGFNLAFAVSALTLASPAFSTAFITSAAVTGPTGTVWDTTSNGYYTLFVQFPFGNSLNPNDEALNASINPTGASDYTIGGDGWPLDTKFGNSDPYYTLTLGLEDGALNGSLSGVFDLGTGIFTVTSAPLQLGNTVYSLTDFAWSRTLSNVVGSYSTSTTTYPDQPIGSKSDYLGAFTVTTASAVPEPATWGMMIVGFGLAGSAMRRRRTAMGRPATA